MLPQFGQPLSAEVSASRRPHEYVPDDVLAFDNPTEVGDAALRYFARLSVQADLEIKVANPDAYKAPIAFVTVQPYLRSRMDIYRAADYARLLGYGPACIVSLLPWRKGLEPVCNEAGADGEQAALNAMWLGETVRAVAERGGPIVAAWGVRANIPRSYRTYRRQARAGVDERFLFAMALAGQPLHVINLTALDEPFHICSGAFFHNLEDPSLQSWRPNG